MVACICNSDIWKVKTGGLPSSSPAWSTEKDHVSQKEEKRNEVGGKKSHSASQLILEILGKRAGCGCSSVIKGEREEEKDRGRRRKNVGGKS